MNYFPAVAFILGKEIGEEFLAKGKRFIYKFKNDGLYCYEGEGGRWYLDNPALQMFLNGELEIEGTVTPHNKKREYYKKERFPETICHDCERIDQESVNHIAYMTGTRPRNDEEAQKVRSRLIALCCYEPGEFHCSGCKHQDTNKNIE